MSTEYLKKYIKAVEAVNAGDKEKGLKLWAESVGVNEPTAVMRANIDSIANPDPASLSLILHNSKGAE